MSVTVVVDLAVKPEEVEGLISVIKEILSGTREYEGNQAVELYRNQDDRNNLILIERWDSRQQCEKYVAWCIETGVMDQFGAALAGLPSIRYFDHLDT